MFAHISLSNAPMEMINKHVHTKSKFIMHVCFNNHWTSLPSGKSFIVLHAHAAFCGYAMKCYGQHAMVIFHTVFPKEGSRNSKIAPEMHINDS